MGQENAKSPVKTFSKSKFKTRVTRCTLINYHTPILQFQSSGTYGLGWGGDTEKKKKSKITAVPTAFSFGGTIFGG